MWLTGFGDDERIQGQALEKLRGALAGPSFRAVRKDV
jgi:hypothetical protein